jgi:hypothetical protein
MLNCGGQITTVRAVGRIVGKKKVSAVLTRPAAVARLNFMPAYQRTVESGWSSGVNQLQPSRAGLNGLLGSCAAVLLWSGSARPCISSTCTNARLSPANQRRLNHAVLVTRESCCDR